MLKGVSKVGIQIRRERGGMLQGKIENKKWLLLCNEFVRHETARGKKSIRKLPYTVKPLLRYLEYYDLELNDVNYKKASEYQTYLTTLVKEDGSLHYTSSTVAELMNIARRFYDFLKSKQIVYTNPFRNIGFVKKDQRLPRHIPKEDVMDRFLETLKCFWLEKYVWHQRNLYKIHVIAELMYATGLRISEIANLEVDDIDIDRGIVNVRSGKGGRDRKAYLNEYAAKVLRIFICEMREYINYNKKSNKLFGVKDGKSLDSALNRWLKKIGKKAGIKRFTSHIFRHALGFHLLRRGCGLRFIQLILGHEEINSTAIYTKVEKTDLRNELDTCHPRKFRSHRSVRKEES
jgi:site-specific recombinase XerD